MVWRLLGTVRVLFDFFPLVFRWVEGCWALQGFSWFLLQEFPRGKRIISCKCSSVPNYVQNQQKPWRTISKNAPLCPTAPKINKIQVEQIRNLAPLYPTAPGINKSPWQTLRATGLSHKKNGSPPFFIMLRLQIQPIIGRLLNFTDIFPVLSLIVITA